MRIKLIPLWALLITNLVAESPSLTIYNGNFAVIRQTFDVDLAAGLNEVTNQDITRFVEADSVVFRDLSGDAAFRILEQNYEGGVLDEALLLSQFEGQEIQFKVGTNQSGYGVFENGTIIRGGRRPLVQTPRGIVSGLPGSPIFPNLGEDSILKPRLSWKIAAERAQRFPAELSYISSGLSWKADYNVVARGDLYDIVGWVTLTNNSGTDFESSKIKLMAGEVNKLPRARTAADPFGPAEGAVYSGNAHLAEVTQKAFADFQLYTLPYATDLENEQTKQVEFLKAEGVVGQTRYVVDLATRYQDWRPSKVFQTPDLIRNEATPKVQKRVVFENKEANQLGMPIPAGRMRFYQSDAAALEFIGEDSVSHTPKDETIELKLGNAFDLVAEREQTRFQINKGAKRMEETIEYRLANRKDEPVLIEILEPLIRSATATVLAVKADSHERPTARAIHLEKALEAGEEATVVITVEYTW